MNTGRYPKWKLAKTTGYDLEQTTATTYQVDQSHIFHIQAGTRKKLREGGEEGSGYSEVSKIEVEATFQPQKDKETKEVYFCLFLPISHVIDSLLISQRSLKQ